MSDETKAEKEVEEQSGAPADVGRPAAPVVNWDDSQMRTTYANVVNAASTREEERCFLAPTRRGTRRKLRSSTCGWKSAWC